MVYFSIHPGKFQTFAKHIGFFGYDNISTGTSFNWEILHINSHQIIATSRDLRSFDGGKKLGAENLDGLAARVKQPCQVKELREDDDYGVFKDPFFKLKFQKFGCKSLSVQVFLAGVLRNVNKKTVHQLVFLTHTSSPFHTGHRRCDVFLSKLMGSKSPNGRLKNPGMQIADTFFFFFGGSMPEFLISYGNAFQLKAVQFCGA